MFASRDGGVEIEIGSIGWEDEDEWYYLGTDDNDGHTLVRVQLFSGRDITAPLNPTRAQGKKIICQIPSGMYRIPKKDERCYVLIPKGMEAVDGAGLIIATVGKSPTTQFAADRAVLNFGDDVHVVIKGKSISLQDPDFRFVSVGSPRSGGTPGVQVHLPDGTGAVWQDSSVGIFCKADTLVQMTPSKYEVWQGTGSSRTFLTMGSGVFHTFGQTNKVQGSGVYLGAAPTLATPVLYGPTGIAGLPSTGVFVSPVFTVPG